MTTFLARSKLSNLKKLLPKLPKIEQTAQDLNLSILMKNSLHLGHSTSNFNQKMLSYIYGSRMGLYIINLESTMAALRLTSNVTREIASKGGNVLFVGTRPMLHDLVIDVATKNNAYFCTHWIGGLFTNKERVLRRSVGYDPDKVTQSLAAQGIDVLDTAEVEDEKIEMKSKQPEVAKPDLVILLDFPNTKWAAHEAYLADIPVIAVCDTDCDPTLVQYPIPANDDSLGGLQLIAETLGHACKEGHELYLESLK